MAIVLKERGIPQELFTLQTLHTRAALPSADDKRLLNLQKGTAGEDTFSELINSLQNDAYIFHDLCLIDQHSTVQIDTLLITESKLFIFEVKNYKGDYIYENSSFFLLSNRQEILNPLHQLKRTLTIVRALLASWKISLPVDGSIVFVHPEFTLYQAPCDAPIIFPAQLPRLLTKLNRQPSTLSEQHKKAAANLLQNHLSVPPQMKLPDYSFNDLKKGISCAACRFMTTGQNMRKIICNSCGHIEHLDTSILRTIDEFIYLFPDKPITTATIQQWCSIQSAKTIRRVLKQHFIAAGSNKQRQYIKKPDE